MGSRLSQPRGCGAHGDAAGLAQPSHAPDPGDGHAALLGQGLDGLGNGGVGVIRQEDPADLVSAEGLAKLLDAHNSGGILQLAQQFGTSEHPFLGAVGRNKPTQVSIIADYTKIVKKFCGEFRKKCLRNTGDGSVSL